MLKCQDCGSTENVRRVWDFEKNEDLGLKCWDCREDRIMSRMAQGGVDDRPISGPWKDDTESLNTDKDNCKEGEEPSGQTGLGDFV